jgi:hypothetical protein
LRETRAKMLIAENKRRLIEEERKIAKLNSPAQIMEDAMKMVEMAERAAKLKNDHKVAGWAQTVATSYSESIAKSSPDSFKSGGSGVLESVKSTISSLSAASAGDLVQKKFGSSVVGSKSLDFAGTSQNCLEAAALRCGVLSEKKLLDMRRECGRALDLGDLIRQGSSVGKIEAYHLAVLMQSAVEDYEYSLKPRASNARAPVVRGQFALGARRPPVARASLFARDNLDDII